MHPEHINPAMKRVPTSGAASSKHLFLHSISDGVLLIQQIVEPLAFARITVRH